MWEFIRQKDRKRNKEILIPEEDLLFIFEIFQM